LKKEKKRKENINIKINGLQQELFTKTNDSTDSGSPLKPPL
jgi:hypothetical protein